MSAPVLVACAGAMLAVALPVVAATGSLAGAHRAAGVADAAALAAADAASGWVDVEPCRLAEEVALASDVALTRCDLELDSGRVRVEVSVRTMLGTAYAHARAGPLLA